MARYWMSWEERSQDYRPIRFPPGPKILGWWCSGEAGDGSYHTIVAVVEADDPWDEVEKDWPGAQDNERFCGTVADDYVPGDRFPLDSEWMVERFGAAATDKVG